jgi:hypothetical protein
MFRLQRHLVAGMRNVRSFVVAPRTIACALVGRPMAPARARSAAGSSLADLSVEELANLQITSVSRT